MNFSVSNKVFEKFPNAKFGALLIRNIDNSKSKKEISQLLEKTVSEVSKSYNKSELKDLGEIRVWRNIFEQIGLDKKFSPSHEALLSRVVKSSDLPSINPLVDIYNIISLKNLIPVGGHDIDKAGDIKVDVTNGDEIFQRMNSSETETVEKDEIAYINSENKILTRHFVWRQSEISKVDESSQNILIPIDNVNGNLSEYGLRRIASEITLYIQNFLGGDAQFSIIDNENPKIDFNSVQKFVPIDNIDKIISPEIITDEKIIDDILSRGISNILPDKDSFKDLLMSGKRITIYQGYDPTASSLHIGNAIGMRFLEKFRKLGHKIIFLIGTGTGKIGDPTDKSSTRKVLTENDINNNIQNWIDQASQILDFNNPDNPVEIVKNGEWLKPMTLDQFLTVGNNVTIQQLLERDMFQKRLSEGKPITVSEVLYPILQGYDSVVLKVDAEFGGNDQLFNMMMGRTLEKTLLGRNKYVITGKLLADSQGIKMGKSLGNVINLTDEPKDIYGKVMSFTDGMIAIGLEILTDMPMDDINRISEQIDNEEINPIKIKKHLAFEVTKWIKGQEGAEQGQKYFEDTIQNQNAPSDMLTIRLSDQTSKNLLDILSDNKIISSKSDGKRLIKQNGIEIDGEKISDKNYEFNDSDLPKEVKIGKHNWVRII